MTINVAASVRARLSTQAKKSGRPFQEVLQYYGLERFLYRFSQSEHRDRFVLKGALLLRIWHVPESRPTRDIDFLGYVDNSIERVVRVARDVCQLDVEDDGLTFDESTIAGERIKEDADYEGVRVKFIGFLEKARIPMQLDVAFGDVVNPSAEETDYPTTLEFPAPRLRTYPRETVVAEKFQAMVYLGTLNSRMKDFFDIWSLSRHFDFDGADLAHAVQSTFQNRRTDIEPEPVALTAAFSAAENAQKQWASFVKRSKLGSVPEKFDELREPLRKFLLPMARALANAEAFAATWRAPGPWR